MENLLTVEQAAERLQIKPYTVREHLKRGILRGIKRGRLWRVPESALSESSAPTILVKVIQQEWAPFVFHDDDVESEDEILIPAPAGVRVMAKIVSREQTSTFVPDDEPLCADEDSFPPLKERKVMGHVVRRGRLPHGLEPDEDAQTL